MTDEEKKLKRKEYHKKYYQENKEYRKKYYQENKEYRKKYYQENKEYHKKYYQENKDKIREYEKNYSSLEENKDRHNILFKQANNESRTYASNYRQEWTYEEVCKLASLREQGKSCSEIAYILGRTIGGVKAKLRKIHYDGHNYNPEQKDI